MLGMFFCGLAAAQEVAERRRRMRLSVRIAVAVAVAVVVVVAAVVAVAAVVVWRRGAVDAAAAGRRWGGKTCISAIFSVLCFFENNLKVSLSWRLA